MGASESQPSSVSHSYPQGFLRSEEDDGYSLEESSSDGNGPSNQKGSEDPSIHPRTDVIDDEERIHRSEESHQTTE